MARFVVELNGITVLRAESLLTVANYLEKADLQPSGNIKNLPDFPYMSLSANGDDICGFVYNTQVTK